ncbi:radical SAM protein [Acetatifactor aquisgranensis]|uniref:radical SAM protein n=1 Tax=Acetatifactor aquisgranensis TaxID=2941233 RepID=UPI0020414717|nr:radical SAM protein [Acetatifactor aquisgranensis]
MNCGKLIEDVNRIQKETDKLYIYGAGFYGKDVYRALHNNGIKVDGFLVTKEYKDKTVFGLPVVIAREVLAENIGIVVGLSDTYVDEVLEYLKKNGVDMSHVVNGGRFITDTGGREDLRDSKVLEVSTIMGCSVNCKFCPQDVMLKKYYENDRTRQRVMTVDNFRVILEHTPKKCIIDFSGMTEPFNNPYCLEMIKMACEAGRKVYLFTTLAEVDEDTVDELLKLPVYYVTLHVADRCGYAYIPTTESYYRNVEKVVSAVKADGTPFIDFINAQTDPDERVAEIVKGKYEVMRSVQNRAGNVKEEGAQHREKIIGTDERISCCFCGDDISNNVVLPDGTLLICNMDYGMKHVLGNLYEEDYDSIRSRGELQRVIRAMKCEEEMDELLCRSCLLARVEEK